MATDADRLVSILETLDALYATKVDSLSHEGKQMHYRSIQELETSRNKLEGKIAAASGNTGGLKLCKLTLKGEN